MNQKTMNEAPVKYMNTSGFPGKVTAWQGLRGDGAKPGRYLISGTSLTHGLLYAGPLEGGGESHFIDYPGATTTSAYGPDDLGGGRLRVVGSYKIHGETGVYNHGFVWEGTIADLPSGGSFRAIDYPGAKYQFTHSTMGGLAVGNADGPVQAGDHTLPLGPGTAYLYDVERAAFVTDIVYPGSKGNTAYGIWHDGGTRYVLCGGYSPVEAEAPGGRVVTQLRGFLVDYDAATGRFSHWKPFDYPTRPAGVDFGTHFEGISSVEPGVYTLSADSGQTGSAHLGQGSWVRVTRKADGTFDDGAWVDLNYPGTTRSVTSSNSVYGQAVVGLILGTDPFAYQAIVAATPRAS